MYRFLITFLLYSLFCTGQDSPNFKHEIESLLGSKTSLSISWRTCNEKDSYFLNDTIILATKLDIYKCSEFIDWNFVSTNKFRQSREKYIQGTHASFSIIPTILYGSSILKMKVKQKKDGRTILKISSEGKNIMSFLVVNFEKNTEEGNRITLLKI